MIVFDRTRTEEAEQCMRKRYWHAEHRGRGIERLAQAVPQVTGTLIHEPLACLLTAAKEGGDAHRALTEAIATAQATYRTVVRDRGLLADSFDGDDAQVGQILREVNWQVEEQMVLIEAIVKAWALIRLPALMAEFEVIAVEQEIELPLASFITMLTRPDAILRRRGDGAVFVLNFKSVSDPNKIWLEQWRYNQQTVSEPLAADWWLHLQGIESRTQGVLIEGLVKGKRNIQWPDDSGQWRHNSPLLYALKSDPGPPFPPTFAVDRFYQCTEPHKMGNGRHCPGGKSHRRGDDFQRFATWREPSGIAGWIQYLAQNEPEVLRAQFVNPPPIVRSEFELERWLRSVISREQTIAEYSHAMREEDELNEERLDQLFPMSTAHGNCIRPSRCPFLELCWGVADADDRQLYKLRDANHPQEATYRGWVEEVKAI